MYSDNKEQTSLKVFEAAFKHDTLPSSTGNYRFRIANFQAGDNPRNAEIFVSVDGHPAYEIAFGNLWVFYPDIRWEKLKHVTYDERKS